MGPAYLLFDMVHVVICYGRDPLVRYVSVVVHATLIACCDRYMFTDLKLALHMLFPMERCQRAILRLMMDEDRESSFILLEMCSLFQVFPFHNSALSLLLNGAMLHSAKMPPTRYEVLSDSSSLHHPCVSVCHSTTILFMRRTHVTSTLRLWAFMCLFRGSCSSAIHC